MSITTELIEEINKFTEEHGKEPTVLKIRKDIYDSMISEIKAKGMGIAPWEDPAIKDLKEKYGEISTITLFYGIKVEIFEDEHLTRPLMITDWEIGGTVGNEYVYQLRIHTPKIQEYKFGICKIE